MVLLAIGVIAGVALGVLVVGFLAVTAYDRGYDDALERRKAWRAELTARQSVVARAVMPARQAS